MAKNKANTATVEQTEAAPVTNTEGKNPIVVAGYTKEQLYDEHKNHSAVMRFLASKGYKTGDIAKFLDKRYQHVRNVLNQKSKKAAPAPAAQE